MKASKQKHKAFQFDALMKVLDSLKKTEWFLHEHLSKLAEQPKSKLYP